MLSNRSPIESPVSTMVQKLKASNERLFLDLFLSMNIFVIDEDNVIFILMFLSFYFTESIHQVNLTILQECKNSPTYESKQM